MDFILKMGFNICSLETPILYYISQILNDEVIIGMYILLLFGTHGILVFNSVNK